MVDVVTLVLIACLVIQVNDLIDRQLVEIIKNKGNEKYVNRQMDSEYEALMAELGTGKPKGPLGQDPQKSRTENLASQPAQNINRVKFYHLPG